MKNFWGLIFIYLTACSGQGSDKVVKTYHDQGKERTIYRDTTDIATQVRYKNFKPLVIDEDW